MQHQSVSAAVRYGGAVGGVALAVVARFLLDPVLGNSYPFVTFYFAVVVTAWVAGPGPTLLATALSLWAAIGLFIPTGPGLNLPLVTDRIGASVFVLLGAMTAALGRQAGQAGRLAREVAERRRVEEALRESNRKLQAILDYSPTTIYIKDAEGRYVLANRRCAEVSGIPLEQIVGKTDYDLFPAPTADALRETDRRVRETGKAVESEELVPGPGGPRTVLSVKFPLADGGGPVSAVGGVSTDITDRKAAEDEARRQRELLALAQSVARVGWFEWHVPTDENRWSPEIEAIYGLPPGGFEGGIEGWRRRVHPDDRPAAEAALRESLATGRLAAEWRVVWPDGTVRWLEARATVLTGAAGRPERMVGVNVDVTDRKRAEAALRASEERFRTFAESGPLTVWSADADGRTQYLSPQWVSYTGLDLAGTRDPERLRQVVHPDDYAGMMAAWAEAQAAGTAYELEFRLRRASDGAYRWFLCRSLPVRDRDGKVAQWVGANTDIDDRKRLEEEVRQGRERLRAALAASGTGTFRWDIRTNALDWDENLDRLFGLPPGKTVRHLQAFVEIVHPEDRAGVAERCRRCAEEGADFEMDFRVVWPDGTVRWLADRGQTRRDAAGRPAYMTGACVDITERKRIEEERERFALLVENSHDFIGICAADGTPLFINRAAIQLVGLGGREQALRTPVADYFFPEDRAFILGEFFPRVARDGAGQVEVRFRHFRTGEAIWMTYGVVALKDSAGRLTALATVSRDVTDRKRAEEALREADRRKDEFLAMLAHELRNPLAPVRNAAEFLRVAGSADPKQQAARDIIARQVRQMARLVDDLLDVSRVTRGRIELRRQFVSLREVVNTAAEASRPLIEAAGHEFRVALPGEELYLDADPTRLAQVVSNLLNNSAKYMDPGGAIRLSASAADGQAVLRVLDTGIGIPPEMLRQVFEPFVQVDRSLERSQGGLGIGLTLVKTLVELHGGQVEAYSDGPGRGSEFVVRLPLAEARPAAPVNGAAHGPANGALPGRRVLLADDNRDSAESLALLLRLAGHDVRVAYDGLAALESARASVPEVVLLDIGMPKLNGYEVARRMRDQPGFERVVLVALTGWGQDEDRRKTRESGFDYHFVKPVDPDELTDLLTGLPAADRGAG